MYRYILEYNVHVAKYSTCRISSVRRRGYYFFHFARTSGDYSRALSMYFNLATQHKYYIFHNSSRVYFPY